jgi:hypothetical protein
MEKSSRHTLWYNPRSPTGRGTGYLCRPCSSQGSLPDHGLCLHSSTRKCASAADKNGSGKRQGAVASLAAIQGAFKLADQGREPETKPRGTGRLDGMESRRRRWRPRRSSVRHDRTSERVNVKRSASNQCEDRPKPIWVWARLHWIRGRTGPNIICNKIN